MTVLLQHLSWIREQFPALDRTVAGQPAAFLDGPGGTQVPRSVLRAMRQYLVGSNANTHGEFETSRRTDARIRDARAAMGDLLGCEADEVVFGANMTTLTFALARAFGRDLSPGDEILVTALDHDANVAPWKSLEERGVVVRTVDIRAEDCTLDLADLRRKLGSRTRLIAVGHASNAVGTINPVERIVSMAREIGALVFVDAVHSVPHRFVDVRSLDCDFLACSVYKFFGPHVGALYGKREHLARLRPYKVRPSSDDVPERFETGTLNHEGLAGTAAAVDYLAEIGARIRPTASGRRERIQVAFAAIEEYERGLASRLVEGLLRVPRLRLFGISEPGRLAERTPTVAVRIGDTPPADLARVLGERGIFAWAGNYYALGLTERLGVESMGGMLRIGPVHYNTAGEIDRALECLG